MTPGIVDPARHLCCQEVLFFNNDSNLSAAAAWQMYAAGHETGYT